jgi:hypothetical protein
VAAARARKENSMNVALKWIIPEEFQPLLSCISPSAFKVVQWQAVLQDAGVLSQRALRKEGVTELAQSLQPFFPVSVEFDFSNKLGSKSAKGFGAYLLEIYFGQLYCPQGLFLDLRARRFLQIDESHFVFQPNGLWVELKNNFRVGMVEIYEGYYLKKPELMRSGLLKVGLIKRDFTDQQAAEVESMLLSHIGGDPKAQEFRVKNFTASFERLFQFLLKNKISLSPDFLYLGVYLAGLYLHLEELGGRYDVEAAYLSARSRAQLLEPTVAPEW